ncbi:MAG TPA: hypothetical protein PL033_09915 [Candidatus Brocadiia bacterium]|nr:hypothetical protein [Candidatus Brocadiia bacterium]
MLFPDSSPEKSKLAVICFFLTHAPTTRADIEKMNAAHAGGTRIAGVTPGRSEDMKAQGLPVTSFPVFMDPDAALASRMGVVVFPTYILLSDAGRIQGVSHSLRNLLEAARANSER